MTAFGESNHIAENSIQENFDKISKENYDRLDRDLDKSLIGLYKKEKTWKLILEILWWLFLVLVGFGLGIASNIIF